MTVWTKNLVSKIITSHIAQSSGWYDSFLRNRVVCSELEDERVEVQPTSGSGQGGVAGPFVWNASFQDAIELTLNSPIDTTGYADDIGNLAIGPVLEALIDNMQHAINNLACWAANNGLKLSVPKTKAIIFTRKYKIPKHKDLFLNGEKIEFVKNVKYLGVEFDSRLRFKEHITNIVAKAKKTLMNARRLIGPTWGLQPKSMRWVYTALVRPVLSYGAIIWENNLTVLSKTSIERVHRLALLMITGAVPSTPTATLEVITGLEPIDLYLKKMALKTRVRTKSQLPSPTWDQIGHNKGVIGHQFQLDKTIARLSGNDQFEKIEFQLDWLSKPLKSTRSLISDENYIFIEATTKPQTAAGWLFMEGDQVTASGSVTAGQSSTNHAACEALLVTLNQANLEVSKPLTIISSNANVSNLRNLYKVNDLIIRCRKALSKISQVNFSKPNIDIIHFVKVARMHARSGANGTGTVVSQKLPIKILHEQIDKSLFSEWEKRWNKMSIRQSKVFLDGPDPLIKEILMKLNKSTLSNITHFITGHSNKLRKHRVLIGIDDDPDCRLCFEDEEKSDHIYASCPALEYWRSKQSPTTDSISKINRILDLLKIQEVAELFL